MYLGYSILGLRGFDHWRIEAATTETLNETLNPKPTLEATQGQILSQSLTDATRVWCKLKGG